MYFILKIKLCRQLATSLEHMAILSANSKDLVIGKFNCEEPATNTQVCTTLGVDRYPSVFFFGFGSFNQGPNGKIFGKSKFNRIAKFTSDLHIEAIYDWIKTLAGISYVQRLWFDFKGFFSGRTRAAVKASKLKERLDKAEYKMNIFAKELEKYKTIEIFDQLKDNGDPFPLLAAMEPDAQNLPFRVCIAELAQEYCKYTTTTGTSSHPY